MHGLLGFAGLLGLVALAFGKQTAVRVAQAILGLLGVGAIILAFLIVTERL